MILCCGEALIDMIPETMGSGAQGFVPHNGGAVFNTAIALGRLGQPVGLLTGMSSDRFGGQLRDGLKASHVDMSHVVTTERPTTLAFVHLEGGHATYSFFDENSAGRMISISDIPPLPGEVGTLFFGGISLAAEPCSDTYAALLARDGATRVVMLDPNIRPGFIEDEARYRSRLGGMIAKADIIKISDEDLDWLIPGGADHIEKARELQAQGPSFVILTKGADGAVGVLRGGDVVRVPSVPTEVVDTVGAGDTFNAGVLASLNAAGALVKSNLPALSSKTAAEALAFGAKVASVTVSRAGANPPWAREL
ncbi:carbohydrate kinase family protein [Shimia biformata]|uniref:carbohydrate kinase family protein n=1 Tax=Shimia biformata TaxID=1294299 RepID=UPI00195259C1|nr:carbohydrate kinase [Shimia biformata]